MYIEATRVFCKTLALLWSGQGFLVIKKKDIELWITSSRLMTAFYSIFLVLQSMMGKLSLKSSRLVVGVTSASSKVRVVYCVMVRIIRVAATSADLLVLWREGQRTSVGMLATVWGLQSKHASASSSSKNFGNTRSLHKILLVKLLYYSRWIQSIIFLYFCKKTARFRFITNGAFSAILHLDRKCDERKTTCTLKLAYVLLCHFK